MTPLELPVTSEVAAWNLIVAAHLIAHGEPQIGRRLIDRMSAAGLDWPRVCGQVAMLAVLLADGAEHAKVRAIAGKKTTAVLN